MAGYSKAGERPIERYEELFAPFEQAMKPEAQHRIGTETEKFGVFESSGAPIGYEGPDGVVGILHALCAQCGWREQRETEHGPLIALGRGDASITLEPGAQLELSGAPLGDLHAVAAELREHFGELERVCEGRGIAWLATGFHPLAHPGELPWVPKDRYGVMREYFPTRGGRGLDMMRRTATVQANFDYVDEEDALRKLRVGLKLAPVTTAMFASSPLYEGELTGKKSLRAEVWLDVDPDRTGLLPALLRPEARIADYVEWALDVPMYLFKRHGRPIVNIGQTFREFWQHGFEGERPWPSDWEVHLNTLFPEVRLKRTLEVRGADSVPRELAAALPALWTGLWYDARALAAAEALTEPLDAAALAECRPSIPALGLGAPLAGRKVQHFAEAVLTIARDGLARRARRDAEGRDETRYLEPLERLVGAGRSPADDIVAALERSGGAAIATIVAATRG
ncbi:MAG: glutamate--cysteine ligase [Myxococcales bacterium]|nr:glutamate--cysteine ligase [Myxococcales bacterium]